LALLGLTRSAAQPTNNPAAELMAMKARDTRLPRTGGLFGGDYARYMADNAPTAAASASSRPRALPPNSPGADGRSGSGGSLIADRAIFAPRANDGAILDRGLAGPEGADFIEIGNPANRRSRREWERKNGPWPRDPATGRNYDVAHIRATADGGTNALDNIRPMHPAEHLAEHMANGDYARWARRAAIARAFGGTVARALPSLEIISGVTGILSGRIRTDSFDNFTSDLMGWPSKEDKRKAFEHQQKQLDPNWKPGDFIV
jgi:hypothetical protein